jgi:hypothetical protein
MMRVPRSLAAGVALVAGSATILAAQQTERLADSTRAQIHTTLRAFYFNLEQRNWEPLTADILAAKVVAHRPAPPAMLLAAAHRTGGASPDGNTGEACASGARSLVDRARISLDGDWAEVSVPSCSTPPSGADEFRLIHFEARWRIVYIDLFQGSVNISADR